MKETTFTPLKRGRYRCNQTREIISRKQTKAYRKSRDNEGHVAPHEVNHETRVHNHNHKKIIPLALFFWEHARSIARCPSCQVKNHVTAVGDMIKCKKCGTTFKAVRS